MPNQNRVTPIGEIVAVPERGTMMGNRGRLHDGDGRIRRPWQVKRWLICLLEFHGRHRQVMAPDRYTELFFLDEATALAAGHRPCFECRRARFLAYRDAWAAGNCQIKPPDRVRVAMIDDRLHEERMGPGRSKGTFRANLDELPDGVFVTLDSRVEEAHLIWRDRLVAGRLHGARITTQGRRGVRPDARIDRGGDPGRIRAGGPSLGSVGREEGTAPAEPSRQTASCS